MRRFALFGAITLALALAVAAGTSIASGSPTITQARTLKFRAVTDEFNVLDFGTAGPSQGDELVFHDVLKRSGQVLGHDGGSCVQTSDEGEFNCVVTFALSGGDIAVRGLATPSPQGTFTANFAVTGGDGVYANARGQGRIDQVSETVANITLHLIP